MNVNVVDLKLTRRWWLSCFFIYMSIF